MNVELQERADIEQAMIARIGRGDLIESLDDLTPRYRTALEQTLTIAAQSEITVLTWAYTAYDKCPDIGAKIAVSSSIQDEVGHAHQQGALLERFGISMRAKTFEDSPYSFKTLMIMEFPVKNYIEFVVAQALLDRAGLYTTKDIELHCSFAPYRRALRKINFEEAFHVKHGTHWTKYYWNQSEATRKAVQDAVDWLFPHGVLWFGVPDALKRRKDQLTYQIRKWSNDDMRRMWLKSACNLAEEIGFKVPAHFCAETNEYVIDHPLPMLLDPEAMTWSWRQASWEEMVAQLKSGGPMRPSAYERIQREEWGDALWS
ncbi:MAG: Phenylacetic acid catabolic protein [Candidimonas sp.]